MGHARKLEGEYVFSSVNELVPSFCTLLTASGLTEITEYEHAENQIEIPSRKFSTSSSGTREFSISQMPR